jgi:hypothetical protein
MIPLIKNKINEITEACRQYKVKSLYLFGSAATGKFKSGSNIDFIADYAKNSEGLPVSRFDYFDFLFKLEGITGQKVDLVVSKAIRNRHFIERIEKEKLLLYAE